MHEPMASGQERKLRLLCVDDNASLVEALACLLECTGAVVTKVTEPEKALMLAAKTGLDLAVVDYDMPHMNGIQLAREIKRIKPELPMVLFSGYSDLAPDELSVVDAHVTKGEPFAVLLETIRKLTAKQATEKLNLPLEAEEVGSLTSGCCAKISLSSR